MGILRRCTHRANWRCILVLLHGPTSQNTRQNFTNDPTNRVTSVIKREKFLFLFRAGAKCFHNVWCAPCQNAADADSKHPTGFKSRKKSHEIAEGLGTHYAFPYCPLLSPKS